MSAKDFTVYNLPEILAREVRREDPNSGKWVRDEAWYASVREKFYNLFRFYQENGLLTRNLVKLPSDVDAVVLKFSDLTVRGQAFVKGRVDERWLASLDRPGTKKKPSDWAYLQKELEKISPVE